MAANVFGSELPDDAAQNYSTHNVRLVTIGDEVRRLTEAFYLINELDRRLGGNWEIEKRFVGPEQLAWIVSKRLRGVHSEFFSNWCEARGIVAKESALDGHLEAMDIPYLLTHFGREFNDGDLWIFGVTVIKVLDVLYDVHARRVGAPRSYAISPNEARSIAAHSAEIEIEDFTRNLVDAARARIMDVYDSRHVPGL